MQNGNIHSTELDVYGEKQSISNSSLFFTPTKNEGGNITLKLVPPSQLVRTGTKPRKFRTSGAK